MTSRSKERSRWQPVVTRSEPEWREALTPEQFHVLREKGTEPAYSGRYWRHDAEGVYRCAACDNALFASDAKFDPGTGWASFAGPVHDERVVVAPDAGFGMHRMEVVCARCGSHLGHVFEDGPPPTGRRFSINSAALTFEPDTKGGPYPE